MTNTKKGDWAVLIIAPFDPFSNSFRAVGFNGRPIFQLIGIVRTHLGSVICSAGEIKICVGSLGDMDLSVRFNEDDNIH